MSRTTSLLRRLRTLRSLATAAAVTAAVLLPVGVATQPAMADTTTCSGSATIPIQNGEYTIQANEWNSSLQQCLDYSSGTAWSVSTANFNTATNGAPATYPSIYKGCHWGACTTGSNLPIQVSNLASATSSWSTTQPASGAYDVAYDLWTNSTPTTTGQPNGSEIMIWLNSRGGVQPFGSQTGTASVSGHSWNVWTGQQTSWKIISYVLQGGGTSVSNLDIKAILADAQSRGSVSASDYLIDAEAGFEIWQGGQGLATNSFSFNATAGSGSTGGTGGTGGGTGGTGGTGGGTGSGTPSCSAALAVASSWSGGLTANATVTNTGTAPLNGWTVKWNWPNGQTITGSWSANVTQSGTSVTASNLSYNGAIAAGGSTSFGFQANASTTALPTATCTAS